MGLVDVAIFVSNGGLKEAVRRAYALDDADYLGSYSQAEDLDGLDDLSPHVRCEEPTLVTASAVGLEDIQAIKHADVCQVLLYFWTLECCRFNFLLKQPITGVPNVVLGKIHDVDCLDRVHEVFLWDLESSSQVDDDIESLTDTCL